MHVPTPPHMFGLCRQHVVISISYTPPPPLFLCKVTRGVSAFLILQYPVSFTKVSLLSCKEAGLRILMQPVCTGLDVWHTVSFNFGNKILLWIESCSSQWPELQLRLRIKRPLFLGNLPNNLKWGIFFFMRVTLYCMKVISLRSFPISAWL